MSQERLLTIIVPIYNVEKYLNECLDSFVNQTVKNFNVLLIDDGSSDNSPDIAKKYVQNYPKMFAYHRQENKGLGGARNTGLSMVKTEYTMFFDSDDFMASRGVENIYKEINGSNHIVDIIFFNPVIYDMVTHGYEEWHDAQYIKAIFSGRKYIIPKENPKLMETEASVCRSVWRTAFLHEIKLSFLEKVHWEDVPPHFLLMHSAKVATFMEYEGAYYYRFNNPMQITAGSGKSRLDMKYIFKEILPYFHDKSWTKDEKIYMLAFLSNYMFWSLNSIEDTYLSEFVDVSHAFFKKISIFLYLRFFIRTKTCLRNKLMIWFLKSIFLYKGLHDRKSIKHKMKLFKKIKGIFKKQV